jgi:hypothetical protein
MAPHGADCFFSSSPLAVRGGIGGTDLPSLPTARVFSARRTGIPQPGGGVLRPLRHDGAWQLSAGRVVHPFPQRGYPLHAALAALPLLQQFDSLIREECE